MATNQLRGANYMGWINAGGTTTGTSQLSAAATWLAFGFVSPRTAKTLTSFSAYLNTHTGTIVAADCTADLYSDVNGVPGVLLESHAADSIPADGNWVRWTSFNTALTAGTQYWIILKNANAVPASNNPTYRFMGSESLIGAGNSILTSLWGWVVSTSTNSGGAWTLQARPGGGMRLGFADGSYAGIPLSNAAQAATTDRAFGKQEVGGQIVLPNDGITRIFAGISMSISKVGAPSGNLRFRLYSGTTLLGTTLIIPKGNISTGVGLTYAQFFASSIPVGPGTTLRITAGDDNATDTSANGYAPLIYTVDGDSNSLPLVPFGGTQQETLTADNTATPPVFTQTQTQIIPMALLYDTDGEFGGMPSLQQPQVWFDTEQ